MTTRAEGLRYKQERSGPKKAARAAHSVRHVEPGLLGRRDRSKNAARANHSQRRAGRH